MIKNNTLFCQTPVVCHLSKFVNLNQKRIVLQRTADTTSRKKLVKKIASNQRILSTGLLSHDRFYLRNNCRRIRIYWWSIYNCFIYLIILFWNFNSNKSKIFISNLSSKWNYLSIFIQFFINIGVVIGLLPVTGVTLPFLSYGGSSLTMNFIMMGILVNISSSTD